MLLEMEQDAVLEPLGHEPWGYFHMSRLPPGDYGHITYDSVTFRRVIRFTPSVGYNNVENEDYNETNYYGLELAPPNETVVFSSFFGLYDFEYDVGKLHSFAENLEASGPFPVQGTGPFTLHPPMPKRYGPPDAIQQRANLDIGFKLHLLNPIFEHCTTPEQKVGLRESLKNSLQRHLVPQLLYCFIEGIRDRQTRRRIRVYFCYYSLLLFQYADEISFDVKLTPNLIHMIQNKNVFSNWKALVKKLSSYDSENLIISTKKVKNIYSTVGLDGIKTDPLIDEINITIQGDHNFKYAALVKLYDIFLNYGDPYHQTNKYLEFFEYKFQQPVYLQNFKIKIQTLPGTAGPGYVLSDFIYHKNQGYIGQALRYVVLGQTNYTLTIDGVEQTFPFPKFVHIRDAHHAIPTGFEYAVMESFGVSNKRFFFALGRLNSQAWHRPADGVLDQHGGITDDSDRMGDGNQPAQRVKSCYAGLQSFRSTHDDDTSILGFNYGCTIGLLFNPIIYQNDNSRDYVYGIRPNGYSADPTPIFFCYGIDERLLMNFFYPLVLTPDGVIFVPPTPTDIAYCKRFQKGIFDVDEALGPIPPTMTVHKFIFENAFFYTIDLSNQLYDINAKYGNNFNQDNNKTNNRLKTDANRINLYLDHVANGYNPNKGIVFQMYAYLRVRGCYPKNLNDFLTFCEKSRDVSANFIRPLHSLPSIYHSSEYLFRSGQPQRWSPYMTITYNDLWPTASNQHLNHLWNSVSTAIAGEGVPVAAELQPLRDRYNELVADCYTRNWMFNISNFNKAALVSGLPANWCKNPRGAENTRYCYGNKRDDMRYVEGEMEIERGPPGTCLTHPYNISNSDVSYTFRGMMNKPPVIFSYYEKWKGKQFGGTRKKMKSCRKRLNNNTGTRKSPKPSINKKMEIVTRVSTREDVEKFMFVILHASFLKKEEIMKFHPSAQKVLTDYLEHENLRQTIKKEMFEIKPLPSPNPSAYLFAFGESDLIYEQHRTISDFLGQAMERSKSNPTKPLAWLDIYLGLSKEELFDVEHFLKECLERQFKNDDTKITRKQIIEKVMPTKLVKQTNKVLETQKLKKQNRRQFSKTLRQTTQMPQSHALIARKTRRSKLSRRSK